MQKELAKCIICDEGFESAELNPYCLRVYGGYTGNKYIVDIYFKRLKSGAIKNSILIWENNKWDTLKGEIHLVEILKNAKLKQG